MNLPKPIVDAVTFSSHRRGDYSATEIIKPPKVLLLTRRHDDEINIDASQRLWPLFGSAVHHVLDNQGNADRLTEEFLKVEIYGKVLTGRPDDYHEEILTDYKMTSVWSVIKLNSLPEWTAQLNMYAYMFRQYGFPVKQLQIVALLKDWSKSELMRYAPNYPECPASVVKIDMWDDAKTLAYIKERLSLFNIGESFTDDEIPICTEAERWHKADKWAVMKTGRKSAVRVLDSEAEAKAMLATLDNKHSITFRPGKDDRCLNYCDCCQFCNHWKSLQAENQVEVEGDALA